MEMKNKSSLFALMLIGSSALAGAPEDILRTAWQDPCVKAEKQAMQVVTTAQGLNPFTDIQFRFEQGQVDNQESQYGLRFYPKGYSEFTAYRKYQQTLESSEQWMVDETLSLALVNRYSLVSRLAYLVQKKKNAGELSLISKKADKVLSYSAQRDRSEIKSYLKGKADLYKIDLKIAEIDREYVKTVQELMGLSLGTPESFDFKDLISIPEIGQRIENYSKISESRTARKNDFELQRLEGSLAYDHARERRWFDYFELSLKEEKKEQIYGIQFAFNLPFLAAPQVDRLDKETKVLRAQAEQKVLSQTAQRSLQSLLSEMKTLIGLYNSMAESRMNANKLKTAGALIANSEPLLAVELQKSWFESYEQLSDIEFQIRTLYIEYLHETSVLAQNPEENFLSSAKKKIL